MDNQENIQGNDSSSNLDVSQSYDENELKMNDFIKKKKIGSGAFGKVYLVEQKGTGELFALKITRQKFDEYTEDVIRDLLREINIISKLDHPNVLKFIGYSRTDFKDNPKLSIFTEYVSKGTLSDLIQSEQEKETVDGWNDTRKLIIIYGIASGMSYLHSHDIIHRDLKPSNILIDENFLPKIADFGFSKINKQQADEQGMQSTIGIKGTPIYMSPEIWQKQEYTKACDVYAFGFIVYEIVTNDKPFENKNYFEIALNVANGDRPEFKKTIPKSYKNLIESCWAQDPNDRPSFNEIVQKLIIDYGFITKSVDQDEYINYIDFIEKYQASFKSSKNVDLNDIKESIDTQFDQESFKMYIKTLNEFPEIFKFFSYDFFNEISDETKNLIIEAEKDINKKFIVGKSIIEGKDQFFQSTELGIKYLKRSIKDGCLQSTIYYCDLLIKGKIIPRNLKKAKKLIKPLQNDHSSIYSLLYGKILKKEGNYNEAKQYFEQSMKEKNGDAMYEYGKMLYKGMGSQSNKEEAMLYYKKAIENNCIKAMYKYGLMIKSKDNDEYVKYIKMAAEKNLPEALFYYSEMLEKGDGVEIDKEESLKYLEKAANEGYTKALYKYALSIKSDHDKFVFLIEKAKQKGEVNSLYQFGKFLIDFYPSENCYKTAAEYIKTAAYSGNTDAILKYGNLLFDGHGVTVDKEEGMRLIKLAVDKGNTDAMNTYGIRLINESNDKEEALKYFKMAADKGDYNGLANYGKVLVQFSDDNQSDIEEGIKYIKLAADNGDADSAKCYGDMLFDGFGVPVNVEESIKYYKKAVENGSYEAMFDYAILLIEGNKYGIQTDQEEGAKYLKIAADNGFVNAMNEYGKVLMYGLGVPINKEEACRYMEKAADRGDITDILNYANILLKENEIPKNKEKAAKYLKIAADKGSAIGMSQYAEILYNGIGVQENKKEALKYYKKAIDNGNMDSIQRYASMLYVGDGVPVDKDEANKYFKIGIDNGDALVMSNYGTILLNYETSQEKKKEGFKYLKMAADEGEPVAMNNLGYLYANGIGTPVNLKKSARYFKMAIDKNYASSMCMYGRMLFEGDCFPKNKAKGCKYLKMAAENGNAEAMGFYGNILEKGDEVPANKEEAIKYYQKGMLLGDYDSMFFYGQKLYEKDKIEGLKLIKRAADHGSVKALYSYEIIARQEGIHNDDDDSMYLNTFMNSKFSTDVSLDEGIKDFNKEDPKAKKEGLDSIKRAADLGNVVAMHTYAHILEEYKEFATDKEEIFKYYRMAINEGYKESMFAYGRLLFNDEGNEKKEEGLEYIKMAANKGCSEALSFLITKEKCTKEEDEGGEYIEDDENEDEDKEDEDDKEDEEDEDKEDDDDENDKEEEDDDDDGKEYEEDENNDFDMEYDI